MTLSTFLSAAVKNPDGTYNIPKSVDRANKMLGTVLGTVLTVRPPIDGVWQFALTRDGAPVLTTDTWHHTAGQRVDALVLADEVTTATDSDAAAAGEHAVDLLLEDFGIVVTTIVYPDDSTVVC